MVVALASSMIVVALRSSPSSTSSSSPPWAARVDGKTIPVSQVTGALRRFEATGQFDQLVEQTDRATAIRQFERMYLVQQIQRLVLRSRLEELQIDVKGEVAQRVAEMSAAYPSEKGFHEALEGSGYTIQQFSALIEDQVVEGRLREEVTAEVTAGPELSERDLREYYREHREDYRQTEVQHILVEEKSLASTLSARLRNAPAEELDPLLVRLAHEHSTDASTADRGGDLGWVSARQLLEPFTSAMDQLDLGDVSLPVSTDFGFHVIRVTGRRAQSFQDVRGEVSQRLTDLAAARVWSQWLQDAYRDARIELDPRYGAFDPETGQIMDASSTRPTG
jgi:parvulin-like peptidyl-prolyl isomerase